MLAACKNDPYDSRLCLFGVLTDEFVASFLKFLVYYQLIYLHAHVLFTLVTFTRFSYKCYDCDRGVNFEKLIFYKVVCVATRFVLYAANISTLVSRRSRGYLAKNFP